MKKKFMVASLLCASFAFAHFGVILPSESVVEDEANSKLNLKLEFTHPFEKMPMNLELPNVAEVAINGEKKSILQDLKEQKNGEN
ncbi:MAG: DUF4198 domain-containing protein, partial [Campylobacter sp.]|nr:DUF4198 domain-containing protein [Campylobacter sp.]